jgi:hypothetical protein
MQNELFGETEWGGAVFMRSTYQTLSITFEIRGSHGGEYVCNGLMSVHFVSVHSEDIGDTFL